MKTMTMVRVYLSEADHELKAVIGYLHDTAKVKGATVFRGISGFGSSGELHTTKLLELSLDLPLVIEFFDESDRIDQALTGLKELVGADHIVTWPVNLSV